jgi:hypothetical protein
VLKEVLASQRKARQKEYGAALSDAQAVVRQHAVHLRETFGGHGATYYEQKILQRGRLERGRRKTSRWNVYVRRELELRNAGMCFSTSHPGAI